MEQLDPIIKHLQRIGTDFYGEIHIKIRAGRAVLITEERTFKLNEEEDSSGNNKTACMEKMKSIQE